MLGGPALGGWLFERIGFSMLVTSWAVVVIVVTLVLAGVKFRSTERILEAS